VEKILAKIRNFGKVIGSRGANNPNQHRSPEHEVQITPNATACKYYADLLVKRTTARADKTPPAK